MQGRLSLALGKAAEADAAFDRTLVITSETDPTTMQAYLGKSMAALAANDPSRAIDAARHALPIAKALQGDLPHSSQTGLVSLWLGRALLRGGDRAEGRKTLEAAIAHLSNTIDADHPYLMQARAELREASSGRAAASREQKQQSGER
jgi:hypothetical protein